MSNRVTPYDELPEYLTPDEFRAYISLSRNTIYELLRRNEIPHVRFGRTIRIPKAALRQPEAATLGAQ
jgi:excisionase family DNA binding protein